MEMKKNITIVFLSIFVYILFISMTSAKIINCEGDFECFLNNSVNCTSSRVMVIESVQFFDSFNVSLKTLFKIRPYRDQCELFFEPKYLKIRMTAELKEQLMNELNLTKWEVRKLEHDINKEIKLENQNKKALICRFKIEDLTAVLSRWREGTFSTYDFENAHCK